MLGRDLVRRHWLIKNSFVEYTQMNDAVPTKLASATFSEHEYIKLDDINRTTAEINQLAVASVCEGL